MPRPYLPTLKVPKHLPATPHPAVAALSRLHEQAAKHERAYTYRSADPRRDLADTRVTASTAERAMCILQAVWTTAEARGWRVTPPRVPMSDGYTRRQAKTVVQIAEIDIHVRVLEIARQDRTQQTDPWSRVLLEPTGELQIEIDEYLCPQRRWADGPAVKIEAKLGNVLAAMEQGAVLRTAQRVQWARQQEVRDAERRRRDQQAALVKSVLAAAESWEQARKLRAFADIADEHADAGEWAAVARTEADKLDPFCGRE